jgi:hypothetical protein
MRSGMDKAASSVLNRFMLTTRLILLPILALSVAATASTLEGRVESIYADGFLANRALAKLEFAHAQRQSRLYVEAFLEADAAEEIPYGDARRARAVLQQLWFDITRARWAARIGLQEMRWSPSWIQPSLDYFTARRYDRFFLDPLPEQLKHPLGLWVRAEARSDIAIEGFASLRTPSNEVFHGAPETTLDARAGGGVRAELKAQGWIFQPLYAYVHGEHNYGFALSHPFPSVTPHLEAGNNEREDFFVSAALDGAWKQWRARPQLTMSSPAWSDEMHAIVHLPISWRQGAHDAGIQLLVYEEGDRFWSAEYGHRFESWLRASAFVQDYSGESVSLLGDYAERLPGWVVGLRVQATTNF